MDTLTWLREVHQYLFDWMTAVKIVTDRIAAGEPTVLACERCGEALGVFRVIDHIVLCGECEKMPPKPRTLAA